MKKGTESQLVRACLQYLTLQGFLCWRANAAAVPLKGGGFRRFAGIRGVADILCVLGPSTGRPGVLLAVECKSATGRMSPHQEWFRDALTVAGGLYVLVRSLADLEAGLRAEGVTFE